MKDHYGLQEKSMTKKEIASKYSGQVENQLRIQRPQIALKADYQQSAEHAIHLACMTCMAGSYREIGACKSYKCPLWSFRPGNCNKELPEDAIPSREEYEVLLATNES